MPKFPVDAPKRRVLKTLQVLGFVIIREKEHISLRTICSQVGISRENFIEAYEKT